MNITMHNIQAKVEKKAAMEERRDRIAIAVLQGSISSGREITDMDALLRWSYEVADAMLKARGE
jgi:hypothetical protein